MPIHKTRRHVWRETQACGFFDYGILCCASQRCLNIYFSDFHSQLNRFFFLCRCFLLEKILLFDSDSNISFVCIFRRQLFNSFFLFLFPHFSPSRKCVKEINFVLSTTIVCHHSTRKKKLLSQKKFKQKFVENT